MCVLYKGTYIREPETYVGGGAPAAYRYDQFKQDLHAALGAYFGYPAVKRGKKAFDIRTAATGGVDADAVPCFEYLNYNFVPPVHGTGLLPDGSTKWISNYPRLQLLLSDQKNKDTNWRYKRAARILKKTNYEMISAGAWTEGRTPSFLLESATWNQANDKFSGALYAPMIRDLLISFENAFSGDKSLWRESNGIKVLFRGDQPWTTLDLQQFATTALKYLGL